jgi:hypothetical protein
MSETTKQLVYYLDHAGLETFETVGCDAVVAGIWSLIGCFE